MRFAPIVPIPVLQQIKDADYHMILAPMLRDQAYQMFYLQTSGFKILDNGAAEGNILTARKLIDLADAVNPDEVIAPDAMHDAKTSIDWLVAFIRRIRESEEVKSWRVMAVLQATNWTEFNNILETALTFNVGSVALPKLLVKHMGPATRLAAAEIVREKSDVPIHCLGCSTHLHEVKELANQGIVRGIDSSAPAVLGLQGQPIKNARYDWELSHSAIPNFWTQESNTQVEVNLDAFRRWCDGPAAPPIS